MDTKEWKDLKNLLSSLLISSPLQLTIRALNNDFRSEVGYYIPYEKFGFRTLEQCLDNMPDVLQRNGSFINACVSSKVAHIDKLISRQTIPANKRSRLGIGRRRPVQRRHAPPIYESHTPMEFSFNAPMIRIIPPLFPPSGKLLSPPDDGWSMIPQAVRRNPPCIITPKPPEEPQKVFTNQLNIIPVNTRSTNQSAQKTVQPPKIEPQIAPAITSTNAKEDTPQKNIVERFVTNTVPLAVQKNLIDLISRFDDGIWCAELPETYQRLFKKELDYTKFGFKNLILMCMRLEKIFFCYRPQKADFILYDREKPLPENFKTHFMQPSDRDLKPTEVDVVINTVPKLLYPLNVLHLFDVIPTQFKLCDIKKEDIIKVCVAEIYHPGLFFIILKKYCNVLDELMDDMQTFYSNGGNEFKIPQHMIDKNLYCVIVYNKEYHRARIIQLLPQETYKVFCIDYGSVEYAKSSDLYYLHKRFVGLPQQAIEARLTGIKPHDVNNGWSRETSLQFLQLTSAKDLFAHVSNVDRVNQRLDMFLVDKSDAYINDALVVNGYALRTYHSKVQAVKEPEDVDHEKKDKPLTRKELLQKLTRLYAAQS